MQAQYQAVITTPIGKLGIQTARDKLTGICFLPANEDLVAPTENFTKEVVRDLSKYFKNPKHVFTIAYELEGTKFQQNVWQALLTLKPGQRLTYKDLAKKLKTGPRAIGNACRYNPIPIIVPCHRIVSVKGLGGFAGAKEGGLPVIKQWLLQHEKSTKFSLLEMNEA